MATCVAVMNNGFLRLDTVSPPDTCAYLLVSSADYAANLNVNALFSTYFDFDAALSATLLGAFLLSFVSGHVLGKILAGLRRV
ncbi:conserved hypothetical protein [Gammaproteobacteria bacterium]